MKTIYSALCLLLTTIACFAQPQQKPAPKVKAANRVIIAYVTARGNLMPDPEYVTHINYAFGHVSKTFDGVVVENEARLKEITGLKLKYPKLKVLLSIGGWKSGRFSEMAASAENRAKFVADCGRLVKEFNLDGIDIDWEYPTSSEAGISSSPEDTRNYTVLMSEIRKTIGKKKLLTLASVSDAKYIDFKAIVPIVDFVNVMTYDMGLPPYHHAGLYRSEHTKTISVDEGVTAHLNAGIPASKLVLGMPFYGHGKDPIAWYIDYKNIVKLEGYTRQWDDKAKAPYLINAQGDFLCSYEDTESIGIKCQYLLGKGLLGAMYWDYAADTPDGVLRKAVHKGVYEK
ncbi:glycoside hydrolase family 18 protein [Pedobacter frigoris]|uniref:chitinase n=1 Tax=Pedobacter frigoris TaxID=2571272 RepID=A0A4U1CGP6_9SPHI|nr:glycoside hydrolase family 18 protein [Pedobacter frigoris]TKC05894.1 glycoside hydrolase family 18 protein [Pedobacter frigoris]